VEALTPDLAASVSRFQFRARRSARMRAASMRAVSPGVGTGVGNGRDTCQEIVQSSIVSPSMPA
jgi:hypothetical protein